MSTRAKLYCQEVSSTVNGYSATLIPVTNSKESLCKWTPEVSIKLFIVNPEAAKQFVPGKEYYVDFTLAE